MKNFMTGIAVACALALSTPVMAASISDAEMVSLQATMQNHIDQNLVDGAVLSLDPNTGDITKLYPAKAHPKMMLFGDKYVLCTDFMDDAGNMVMGNYYMAKSEDHYVVISATYGYDALLERLMADGRVAMAR
jgi:hypothetical protein